jgi:hypothetical protein
MDVVGQAIESRELTLEGASPAVQVVPPSVVVRNAPPPLVVVPVA